jgi:hypothetical protein
MKNKKYINWVSILVSILLGVLIGYSFRGKLLVLSTPPLVEKKQPKWTVEEFEAIKETQIQLRIGYDHCVGELNKKNDDLESSIEACSLTYWISEEAKLLRTNYGDDATPEFLHAWEKK